MMRSSFILIGMFLFATSVRATPEEDHAEAVRALGVTNIVVKNPGYFFYGGEYVQPPYVVTREGDFIYRYDLAATGTNVGELVGRILASSANWAE